MKLTVIIRDNTPLIQLQAPPSYRSVHLELTQDQIDLLKLGENEVHERCFLEKK